MGDLDVCCGLHPPLAEPLGDVTTERLELRRWRRDDLDELAEVFANVEVWRFPFGRGLSRAETEGFLDRQIGLWDRCGFGLWAVVERSTSRLCGFVGLSIPGFLPDLLPMWVEVGWRLHPDVWGRGYATEGATAALDAAFTRLGLPEVCSIPEPINPASVRVCERLGLRFVREAVLPADEHRGAVTVSIYETTAGEWRERRPPA